MQDLKPSRECYNVTSGYRVRTWAAFLEWPRHGETATEFVDRLHDEYTQTYHQADFEIELSRHADGSPKSALVRLRMEDLSERLCDLDEEHNVGS